MHQIWSLNLKGAKKWSWKFLRCLQWRDERFVKFGVKWLWILKTKVCEIWSGKFEVSWEKTVNFDWKVYRNALRVAVLLCLFFSCLTPCGSHNFLMEEDYISYVLTEAEQSNSSCRTLILKIFTCILFLTLTKKICFNWNFLEFLLRLGLGLQLIWGGGGELNYSTGTSHLLFRPSCSSYTPRIFQIVHKISPPQAIL